MGDFIELTNESGVRVTVNKSKIVTIFNYRGFVKIFVDGSDDPITVIESYEEVIAAIRVADVAPPQPAPDTSRWIPVSERLPKRETMVIVRTSEHYSDGREYVCGSWYDANGKFLIACGRDVVFRGCHSDEVTDWMPMPDYKKNRGA